MTDSRELPVWAKPDAVLDLLRLAVPIAVTRMSFMLMGITDAVVLGHYAPDELPYVLNSWLPMGIALGAGMGLLLGVQVLTSEMMGRGETADTGRIFRRGLLWSFGLGLGAMAIVYVGARPLFHFMFVTIAPNAEMSATLSAADIAASVADVTRILSLGLVGFMVSAAASFYLEALRRPVLVTLVSYGGVAVNLVLNLMLVGGWWGVPQMGAEGVAWATTGSRSLIGIVLLGACLLLTPALRRSAKGPSNEPRRQFNVGVGTAISNVAEWGGFNLTYVIATWISLSANAAYGYATQILGLCFMVFMGIGTATSVRVAEAFGKSDAQGVRNAGRLGVAATVLSGLVLMVALLLFRVPISGLLVNSEEAIDGVQLAPLIASLLAIVALATTFDGLQATASMALRAQNYVWLPSLIHIGSFFLVMLPLGYVLGITLGFGAMGMMWAAAVALVAAGSGQVLALEKKTAHRFPDTPSPIQS